MDHLAGRLAADTVSSSSDDPSAAGRDGSGAGAGHLLDVVRAVEDAEATIRNQEILFLSDLDPTKRRKTVCARVARMWDYFGWDDKLAHVDLVLIDATGTMMYVEIPAAHAKKFKELLQEGNVYLLRDFFIQPAKTKFKVVPGSFMMKVTPWTKADPAPNVPDDFPLYAYSLTSFDKLPDLVGGKDFFIDTIGIVTAMSDLLHVRLSGKNIDSLKRTLHLVDIDGRPMDAALWGDNATEFDGQALYETAQSEVLVILLAGTLMKNYKGHDTISCGVARKFYINPDIPEKREYCERLGQQLPAVHWLTTEDDHYYIPHPQTDPEKVEIQYLLSTNPNDYLDIKMICTVTIMQLKSNTWWFMSCSKCHKTSYPTQNGFVCSDETCSGVKAEPRYKVQVIASDGTGQAEFIFFAGVAEQIIGKKADNLARVAARKSNAVPAEISALVSQQYTLNISVSQRALGFGELAFQVNSVDAIHRRAKVFEFSSLASSSKQLSNEQASSESFTPLLTDKSTMDTPSKSTSSGDIKLPITPPHVAAQSEEASRTLLATSPMPSLQASNKQVEEPGTDASSVAAKDSKKRLASGTTEPPAAKRLFKKTG